MVRIKPILSPQNLRGLLNTTTAATTTSTTPHHHHHHLLLPPTPVSTTYLLQQHRHSSRSRQPPPAPAPTPFVPDVPTFLTLIGRGLSQHASKFPTWESLFATTSDQLRELGVEPPRTRRYLLQWRERFRRGQYGIGGDLQHVEGGRAELRVIEAEPDESADPRRLAEDPIYRRKYVVNVPPGKRVEDCGPDEVHRVQGFRVRGASTIAGPYALPLKKGQGAFVTVTENMWEHARGRKIDGGERRRTEVRYKKRIAERREMRERGEL
ncbi:IGR protein motif-domain-containing protein [Biscogniauxia mediterranea]|nr:IGR protein motif-domain-containing protein [Biscogniauxia mediterranea]